MYLLDTDILVNLLGPAPSMGLTARLALVTVEQQLTSSVTLAELFYGAYRRSERTTATLEQLGFYCPRGSGKWFSGTLVVGDGTEAEDGDREWMMARDQMDFRIKLDKNSAGEWEMNVYWLALVKTSLVIC